MELIKSLQDGSVSGKTIAGTQYMMLRNTAKTVYLKKKNKGGFCAVMTVQSVVLGGYDESAGGAGNFNTVVEGLGQYLRVQGY